MGRRPETYVPGIPSIRMVGPPLGIARGGHFPWVVKRLSWRAWVELSSKDLEKGMRLVPASADEFSTDRVIFADGVVISFWFTGTRWLKRTRSKRGNAIKLQTTTRPHITGAHLGNTGSQKICTTEPVRFGVRYILCVADVLFSHAKGWIEA